MKVWHQTSASVWVLHIINVRVDRHRTSLVDHGAKPGVRAVPSRYIFCLVSGTSPLAPHPGTHKHTRWELWDKFEFWAMPRIKTAPSAVVVARKPTHYHLILRPVLQKRFARSSVWTLVVCYVVSYLIGNSHGLNPPRHHKPILTRV